MHDFPKRPIRIVTALAGSDTDTLRLPDGVSAAGNWDLSAGEIGSGDPVPSVNATFGACAPSLCSLDAPVNKTSLPSRTALLSAMRHPRTC